jgi:hypothetical protein
MGTGTGNETILRMLGWLFSRIVVNGIKWIGEVTGASFGTGGESLMVQLPRSMTLDESWVRAGHALFTRVANAVVFGAFLLALVVAAVGGLLGFTTAEAKSVLAVSVIVWYVNRRAMELVGYLMSFANALSAQFANPAELLPGWNQLSELQRGSGEGMMLFATGIAGLLLSLVRWITLLGVNILVVMMPLAILCAIHPATRGWFSMWWRGLLGLILVQVPMALAIGQGQALVARYGAGAGGGVLVAGVACFWLASKMPKMVGGLAAVPGQTMNGFGQTASNVAGFAAAGWAGSAAAQRGALPGTSGMPGMSPGGGPGTTPQPGPDYRSQPLLPAPMLALPPPRRAGPDVIDVYPLSVE